MIIGLTGPSGAGKSTVAKSLGGVVINSDEVYRGLLESDKNLQNELKARFGTCKKEELRPLVFGNAENLKDLEFITHKYIVAAIKKQLAELKTEKLVIIDAAIVLVKTDLGKVCDKVFAVLADRAVRIYRCSSRDGIGRDAVEARINAQPEDKFYLEKAAAAVYNNKDIVDAVQEIKRLIKEK